MRLIDADEIVYRRKDYGGYDDVSDEQRKVGIVYALKEDIEKMPTINTNSYQKWIPCSERLPEPNQTNKANTVWKYYLIQDEYGDMHTASYRTKYYDNSQPDCWVYCNSISVVHDKVVAWMELPELYPYVEEE